MSRLSKILVTELEPVSSVAESYRSLRTAIRYKKIVTTEDKGIVLMVASAKGQEGKTTTAANLGITYAQENKSVVLIDANLRHPDLQEIFAAKNGKGLVHYLNRGAALTDIVSPTEVKGLDLIRAGGQPPNPSELLGSSEMEELLNQLKQQYDVILMDSPPALDYTDASLLTEYSDGVLLIVKNGRTKREWAKQARTQLEQSGARMLGIVFTS
ncbi:CpsD/CapB family tyrosine-protein kinase [Paenibacillus sp. N3.4]|uniref:CpsD/CapB family tyrosine-protein kinase n=1 Tax=Paenibacillus sp. N3.4 TaxID=2603222 RepID=UPI0011CC4D5E|nr:CpsD/CapB family tyrosine-protein kinase [Paenibacillus sp. N3.4]TXK83693.1 CpsD/CapB family tyrosine-protein kinase [Paenibacillus sp. N3.4]